MEREASNNQHRLDALADAARRTSHGDHHYDVDVVRTDCLLCAAIEGRYQPPWMEESYYEFLHDPIVKTNPTEGRPPDPARALRDPNTVVSRDGAVFDAVACWQNAPPDTASALGDTETDGKPYRTIVEWLAEDAEARDTK